MEGVICQANRKARNIDQLLACVAILVTNCKFSKEFTSILISCFTLPSNDQTIETELIAIQNESHIKIAPQKKN